jgi:hypothetical protein
MNGDDFYNNIKTNSPELLDKNVTIFIDSPPKSIEELRLNPINIMVVLEPNQLFGIHDFVKANNHLFDAILTWGETILNSCDNSMFFPFGVSWLDEEYINNVDNIEKKFEVSFLCGAKKMIEGHHLRHRLYNLGHKIKIPKQWHYTLDDYTYNNGHHTIIQYTGCSPGHEKKKLWNSMFSICIENSNNNGYHTEKIIDAFLSKTIPIYWGCPNLEELGYDMNSIIYCKNEDQIIDVVNNLTPEFYLSKKESIEKNFILAKNYSNIFDRFRNVLKEFIEINNL